MLQALSLAKRSGIIALLLATFINWNAYGDIEHTKLKGLGQVIRSEFQYLSPIAGFTLLKRGTLENLYRYGNEEDQTIRLVRSLFYSVDGVNFGATTLPSNICAHLTTSGIGALLNQLTSPEEGLETRLLQVIYKELELESDIPRVSKYTKKERQILRKSSKEFVATLIGAIQETITEEPKYPAHFPEHILLGLFWLKAKNDKREFLTLFRQMPQILKDEKAFAENQAEWLESTYTQEDYAEKMRTLSIQNPDLRGASLVGNLELSTFLAHSYDIWENFLPPIVDYERTFLSSETGATYRFADCGETSIRNFFNIVLKNYQTQMLDTTFIKEKAKKRKLALNPNFLKFYGIHNQLTTLSTSTVHAAWAPVVSRLPKVLYKEPENGEKFYNITGGLKSLLSLFEQLLFLKENSDTSDTSGVSSDDEWASLTTRGKLDSIVEFFSRPGFQIKWTSGHPDPLKEVTGFGNIEFIVNGKPAFTWSFRVGHFSIVPKFNPEEDWRTNLGKPFLIALSTLGDKSTQLALLPWFLDSRNIKEAYSTLGLNTATTQQFLLMNLPLGPDATKEDVINIILENEWENLYPMANKLISKISLELPTVRSKLINAMLKSGAQYDSEVSTYFDRVFGSPERANDLFFNAINENLTHLIPIFIDRMPMILHKENHKGHLPLSYAIERNKPEIVEILLNHGAQIDAINEHGQTALHIAAIWYKLDLMKLLISRGASIKIQTPGGKTARDLAIQYNYLNIVKFIDTLYEQP